MKKFLKAIIVVMGIIVTVSAFVSCGNEETAEQSVAYALDNLTAGKAAEANTRMNYGSINDIANISVGGSEMSEKNSEEFIASLMSNLKYEIVSSKEVDNTNTSVTVNITNVDCKSFYTEWMVDAISAGFKYGDDSEKINGEMVSTFKQYVKRAADNKDIINKKVDVNVVKTKEGWILEVNDDFTDAITGYFKKAGK